MAEAKRRQDDWRRKVPYHKLITDVCACCGRLKDLEWDHIIPWSKGGSSHLSNLQILCHRCNRSKGVKECCSINHALDVMLPNGEITQRDTTMDEVTYQASVPSQRPVRVVKGPNPQVNWRIEEAIKQEIEEAAKRRGIGAGEIIKELWRSQHAELLGVMQEVLRQVYDLPMVIARGESLRAKTSVRDPYVEITNAAPEPAPTPAPVRTLPWYWRWFGVKP